MTAVVYKGNPVWPGRYTVIPSDCPTSEELPGFRTLLFARRCSDRWSRKGKGIWVVVDREVEA